jgi:hypothetical protein
LRFVDSHRSEKRESPIPGPQKRGTGGTLIKVGMADHRDRGHPPESELRMEDWMVGGRGLPLVHDKTVDEWGTHVSWLLHDRATCLFYIFHF